MFVKPKDGRKVIDPATYRELPVEGKEVPRSAYWLRRIKDGDVEKVRD